MLTIAEISYIYPEVFVLTMANIVLLVEVFAGKHWPRVVHILSQLTLLGAFFFTFQLMGQKPQTLFHGSMFIDDFGNFLKLVLYGLGFFVLQYSRYYVEQRSMFHGEFHLLCLFSILGMMVLISSANLLVLYMGLELITLPIYALVAMRRDSAQCAEAGMKYFVMGALATGMMLYGMSMLYGVTGVLGFTEIAGKIATLTGGQEMVALFSLVFVLIGIAFKFGAVPFHMWVPDIYQGAPTSVTLFISTVPKIAALGMAIRLLVDTYGPIQADWQQLFIVLAVLSLFIGNVVAIVQTNIKRLLAYSTIGHIGFIFLGLLCGPELNYGYATFYVVIYAIMSLGAFGILVALSGATHEIEDIDDLRGLNDKKPWIAFLMLLIIFSMAGVPPLAGFYAKFLIITALLKADHIPLAIIAVIFSIIGAFYYLRVIKAMYFDKSDKLLPAQTACIPYGTTALLTVNGLGILALGILPGPLWSWINAVL